MNKVKVFDKEFEIFISQTEIESKIVEIANQMNKDLKGEKPIFLGILNGSFMFASELFKSLDIECSISFLKLTSYQGTSSTGKIKQLIGLSENLTGQTVVILEDIIDTGITLENIMKQITGFEPKKILIASYYINLKHIRRHILLITTALTFQMTLLLAMDLIIMDMAEI